MSADLDTRLRDYGTDLDTAIDGPAARSATPAPARSGWVRWVVPAAAAAMVAAATGVLIAGRGHERSDLPSGVTESTVGGSEERDTLLHGPGDWTIHQPDEFAPVNLAEGAFSWWVLGDDAWSASAQLPFATVACVDWSLDAGGVTCAALRDTPFAPTAMYSASGRSVSVYTNRSDASLDDYVQRLSGHDGTLTVEVVNIGGQDGRLLIREGTSYEYFLAWRPTDGPVAALTTSGLERDAVLDLAEDVVPADPAALPSPPLVLDVLEGSDDDDVVFGDAVLGAIVDGESCALPADHLATDVQDPCVALGDDPMVLTMHGRFGLSGFFGGLVSGDVHRVRVDFADGASLSIVPVPQPAGHVQAFLSSVSGSLATSITALDASGEPLTSIDLTTPIAESVPTTEPAESSAPKDD